MGSIYSLSDLIDMIRRRFLVILGVVCLGTVATVLYALSQQHLYTSSEVLQVQSPRISEELAPTTVEGSSARRLQLIEQQVMARGAVLEMAEKLNLFENAPALRDSEKVEIIRRAVTVSGIAAAREGFSDDGTVSLLRVTADWPSAEGAQRIAHAFAQRTVELSTSSRLEQAEETLEFFKLREDGVKREVAELEAEIAAYRDNNEVTMPGGTAVSQREVERLNEAILTIDRQMISLQSSLVAEPTSRVERRQQEENRAELARLTEERALLTSTLDELTESLEASPEVELQLARYDLELQELREQLQTVQARRKDAAISYELESERQSERLTVLEPAPLPDYPFTRARKQIVILGAFASLLLGLGIAFLLDLRHPVIRSATQMEREIGLRPVITIPESKGVGKRRKRPKRGVKRTT